MSKQISIFDELIIDSFAGGGGASTGIELATGKPVDIAINHDPSAIAMHAANHPFTRHFCESVWDVNPRTITQGKPVALAWFSPDCKHFSKAKGGKPVSKEMRGLAWVAIRWAATVRPRVIMLENVEEFKTWGPIGNDGKPDKTQTGRTFNSFVIALRKIGYTVDWRELRACDYGAPTIRKRFFLIARCDGQPIVWPEPTHAAPISEAVRCGMLKPWRTASEIIDWSLPCPSIFDTREEIMRKYGMKAVRPLAVATLRRIARGIRKFVIDSPEPFIVDFKFNNTPNGSNEPFRTVTSVNGYGLATSTLIQYHGEQTSYEIRGQSVKNPLMTVDATGRYALVTAFMSKYYDGGYQGSGNDTREPLNTVTTVDHNALVTSHLVKCKGDNLGQLVGEPLQTITAGGNHFGEVRAFLVKYYGQGDSQSVNEPLHTITGKDTFGLVTIHGRQYVIIDIGLRMLTPRELFNAQGFPQDYIIDTGPDGKPISKTAQVARCGNAVCPPLAEALVRVNLPELCGGKIGSMAEMEKEMVI